MADYSHLLIKEYPYWTVSVAENQNFLGRCTIWCKRENATDFTEMTEQEMWEFMFIVNKLKHAIKEAFQADLINCSFLGNKVPHLHCHFVPRYQGSRLFSDMVFVDTLWGQNWRTDESFKTPPEVRQAVRLKLKELLNN